jgi:hypothetical protein
MLTGKKIIIFGAGVVGQSAFYCFGADRVACFADNFKHGRKFCGKDVISFEELLKIHRQYEVIVSVTSVIAGELQAQCAAHGIGARRSFEVITPEDFAPREEIARFKGLHGGRRCFVIGNGPSLRTDDLDRLRTHGEITFASNRIDRAFPYTDWRPDYYTATDVGIYNDVPLIAGIEAGTIFLPCPEQLFLGDAAAMRATLDAGKSKVRYFHVIGGCEANCNPFSADAARALYSFATVTVALLQMAAYVGCSEIYLIGVDNTPGNVHGNKEDYLSAKSHFYEENDEDFERVVKVAYTLPGGVARMKDAEIAYRYAEKYSREHGFRIYNATRGGVLEAFERVNFDLLFAESEDL